MAPANRRKKSKSSRGLTRIIVRGQQLIQNLTFLGRLGIVCAENYYLLTVNFYLENEPFLHPGYRQRKN